MRSIDPDAIRFPDGSNLAEKISPVCPDSSITGALSPLVRGAYPSVSIPSQAMTAQRNLGHTAWISAPLLPDAPERVRARLEPTFCRLTTSCPPLGSSEAGLFSEDIVDAFCARILRELT